MALAALAALALGLAGLGEAASPPRKAALEPTPEPVSTTLPVPAGPTVPEQPAPPSAEPPPAPPPRELRSVQVRRGDSLARIFRRLGIPAAELAALLETEQASTLARLRPGERLDLELEPGNGRLAALSYRPDPLRRLRIERRDGRFQARWEEVEVERRLAAASGRIERSLFVAGQAAGLSDRMIMELAAIFGWDIDFALEIRPGDRFAVLYEERYGSDGKLLARGPIVAAEFVNRDRIFRAVRYAPPGERAAYYTPEGLSMRKAFLRTPVRFSRVSSRFSRARKHPVLNRIRAHKGTDYAAPRGTPVKASGDGKVVFVGRKGGYGKTIILRHGGVYSTLYAHLSRFARGLRRGRRVRQGEVIGYVGSTGLVTGPHLHYEFRVRGAYRDPLTVRLPRAAPVPASRRADFLARTRDLVSRLDALAATRVAAR